MTTSDPRHAQLLDLARAGDVVAAHDLWAEYGVDAAHLTAPQLPEPEEPKNQTNNTKE